MPQAIPIIVGVATVGATLYSASQQRKAAKAQQQAERVRSRQETRRALRATRASQATAMVNAIAAGAGDGSGIEGGLGSSSSQLADALGINRQISGLNIQASKFASNAATGQAAAQIFQTAGSVYKSYQSKQGGGTPDLTQATV